MYNWRCHNDSSASAFVDHFAALCVPVTPLGNASAAQCGGTQQDASMSCKAPSAAVSGPSFDNTYWAFLAVAIHGMPCGGRPKSAAVVSSITVAPCVLLPSRKPSLPCGLRSKSFPPVVAAGRAVLPAVSHQQEAARIMYQSVCADMCGQGCLMWQRKWYVLPEKEAE